MLEHMISLSDAATAAVTTAENTGTALDKLILGVSVSVLGMLVVFLGLFLLIIITVLYPKITKALIARSSARKEKVKIAKKPEVTVAMRKAVSVSDAKSSEAKPAQDDALIAVITAAIAASLGTSSNGVVIKSIERTGQNVPSWGARGRIEQVYNRF